MYDTHESAQSEWTWLPLLATQEATHDRDGERSVLAGDRKTEDGRVRGGPGEGEETEEERDEDACPYCVGRSACVPVDAVYGAGTGERAVPGECEDLTGGGDELHAKKIEYTQWREVDVSHGTRTHQESRRFLGQRRILRSVRNSLLCDNHDSPDCERAIAAKTVEQYLTSGIRSVSMRQTLRLDAIKNVRLPLAGRWGWTQYCPCRCPC